MKKLLITLGSAVALMAHTAVAEVNAEVKDVKIGVVDVQRVLEQAPQVKKINDQLEKEFKSRQADLEKEQKKLQDEFAKLEKNQAVMNAAERGKKEEALRRQQRDLRLKGEDFQQDANAQQNLKMQQFFEQLAQTVNQVAKDEQLDLVLQQDGLPYVSDKLDITPQVVDALKKQK
jgi:outer membrane protein